MDRTDKGVEILVKNNFISSIVRFDCMQRMSHLQRNISSIVCVLKKEEYALLIHQTVHILYISDPRYGFIHILQVELNVFFPQMKFCKEENA